MEQNNCNIEISDNSQHDKNSNIVKKQSVLFLLGGILFSLLILGILFIVSKEDEHAPPECNASGYYEIYDSYQLVWFSEHVNSGNTYANAILMNNIDMLEINELHSPIGTKNHPYNGVFDGNGYTVSTIVSNSTKNQRDYAIGFFGYTGEDATLKNLTLSKCRLDGSFSIGGIVGYAEGSSVISCKVDGSVSGDAYIGGIVGYNDGGIIEDCYNYAIISGSSSVGSITGYNNYGTITSCSNDEEVDGFQYTGGIVGYNNYGAIDNCINSSYIDHDYGGGFCGGIVGFNNGTVDNCTNTSDTGRHFDSVGGIVGENAEEGVIKNCNNSGHILGSDYVGGIAGVNSGAIENCFNSGKTGNKVDMSNMGFCTVGGIVAKNNGIIKNCTNTGEISASSRFIETISWNIVIVGGIVGSNKSGQITECKNTGYLSLDFINEENYPYTTNLGGIVGYNENGTISNCSDSGDIGSSYVGYCEYHNENDCSLCNSINNY